MVWRIMDPHPACDRSLHGDEGSQNEKFSVQYFLNDTKYHP